MIAVITGVVTVGGVEYPVQTQITLPDNGAIVEAVMRQPEIKEKKDGLRPSPDVGS